VREKLIKNGITISEDDVNRAIEALGGRLADLDLFCRKVKGGLSPTGT
jgi:hypothetical protein